MKNSILPQCMRMYWIEINREISVSIITVSGNVCRLLKYSLEMLYLTYFVFTKPFCALPKYLVRKVDGLS